MFRKKKQTPTEPTKYPIGSFIETEKGYFYIRSEDARFRIITKRVLDSWAPHSVIPTSEAAVGRYKVVAKLKFRSGSLLYSLANGKLYLVSEHKLRHVINPDALTRINRKMSEAVYVSVDELNLHKEGEPLA